MAKKNKVEIPKEIWDKLLYFLNIVGDGYFELSHLKVEGEYRYYKTKAKEILGDLIEAKAVKTHSASKPISPSKLDDDF